MCPANRKPHPNSGRDVMTTRATGEIPQASRGNHIYCNFPVSQSSEVPNKSLWPPTCGRSTPRPASSCVSSARGQRKGFQPEPRFLGAAPQATGDKRRAASFCLYSVPSPHHPLLTRHHPGDGVWQESEDLSSWTAPGRMEGGSELDFSGCKEIKKWFFLCFSLILSLSAVLCLCPHPHPPPFLPPFPFLLISYLPLVRHICYNR